MRATDRLLLASAVLLFPVFTLAAEDPLIGEIRIVSRDGAPYDDTFVRSFLSAEPGEPADPQTLSNDVRALLNSGRFTYADVSTEAQPDGTADITYTIQMRQRMIGEVTFDGLDAYTRTRARKAILLNPGDFIDETVARAAAGRLRALYLRDRYFDVFRRSGFDFGEAFTSLFSTPVDQQQFADITPPKKDGETWIAIAPFAKHAGKIYPTEKMAEVVATLAARPATKIFLFGGGGDEQLKLREWAGQHDNVISMAEKRHGFPKELALLSCVDAMVSMDSANMHLASLVQVPVVSVWGATHPFCGFTGWKQSPDNAVQLDLDCRPCSVFGNKPCYRGDYRCLNGIAPEAIVRKVETVLKSKRR